MDVSDIVPVDEISNVQLFKRIESSVKCQLCSGIIINPYQCPKCGYICCKNCLEGFSLCKSQTPIPSTPAGNLPSSKEYKPCGCDCDFRQNKIISKLLAKLEFKKQNSHDSQSYEERIKKIKMKHECKYMENKIKEIKDQLNIAKNENKEIGKVIISVHQHPLVLCKTKRFSYVCDECGKTSFGSTAGYYCTICDYDFCVKCYQKKIGIAK